MCSSDHKDFIDEESSTDMNILVVLHGGHKLHFVVRDLFTIYDFTTKC